ncbi:tyrosine-type recombinase/integrase [Roseovarius sp. D22-M7]|uniref:tyrosine-type recombinase/integrase n=1 Tax=Roseovarius sp. D22-M7 TaxID=3127116 RepID=UPI0030105BC8
MTTKAVEAAKPDPNKRLEIPDPALSGLYLVVQPGGAKGWALRYRYAGKPRKLTLGRWPIMGVADARAAASEAIEAVEHGDDPGAAKKQAKAARIDAQLSERDTVRTMFDTYRKRRLTQLKAGDTVQAVINKHVMPKWGDRRIQDIARRDVIELLEDIVESGRAVTANRTRAYLSAFFAWAVERDAIATSPITGTKPPSPENSRERVLSDDELRWLWLAAGDVGQPFGPLARLLILTGQRRGEVAGMTEAEINGDTWHLPAARTKNGRAHSVPLTQAAQDVLTGVERIKGRDGFIFTTTGTAPVSGFTKAHARLVRRMTEIAREERGEPVEIPAWTFHDLRRTCATGLARLGIPVRVTEAVLNHVSGSAAGIVSVYQRHDYADEKRAALDAWARLVADLVEGRADNVVQIEGLAR